MDESSYSKEQGYGKDGPCKCKHAVIIHEAVKHYIAVPVAAGRDLNSVKVGFDHFIEFFLRAIIKQTVLPADLPKLVMVQFVLFEFFVGFNIIKFRSFFIHCRSYSIIINY